MTTKHYLFPQTEQGQDPVPDSHPDYEKREAILDRMLDAPSLTFWTLDGVEIRWHYPHTRTLEDARGEFADWLHENIVSSEELLESVGSFRD